MNSRPAADRVLASPERGRRRICWKEYRDTVVAARREVLHAVLRRGVATGEIRADRDIELLVDLFVGPLLSRALMHEWQELPAGLAERIVDTVLDGVRNRP